MKLVSEINRYLNLPNLVTLSRLFLGLTAAGLIYMVGVPYRFEIGACLLVLATALDLFDGFLARRLGSVTQFGAAFDPFVDKTVVNIFFCILVYEGVFEWWLVVFALIRDVLVQVGRIRAVSYGVVVRTFRVSDTRNVLQIIAVLAGILSLSPHTGVFSGLTWGISLVDVARLLFIFGLVLGYIGMAVFFADYWRTLQTRKSKQ